MKEEPGFIPVGGVVKAHGIRGEFGIRSYADSPTLFDDAPLYLSVPKGRPKPLEVASWREHKDLVLMTSPQVTDRDQAEALRGREILVREADLPELDGDEHYLYQMIGCRVVLEDGAEVGELKGYYETGEQDTWVIESGAGVEILLPAVPEFVLDVDLDAQTIVIAPPEGLLDLYLNPDPPKEEAPSAAPPKAVLMNFHLVSIFPRFFESPFDSGLMSKAVETGLVGLDYVDVRQFAGGVHKSVDDRPFGGGPGMLLKLDPMVKALDSIESRGRILMLSPRGKPLSQAMSRELSAEQDVTVICGRYEGIDERLLDLYPIELVSVGDFVLNGGEAAAVCLVESVARLLPGFMGHEDSGEEESFTAGLLEYPHYTRPEDFEGLTVPEVLRSGDHGKIAAWRREESLTATLRDRPDVLPTASLTVEDIDFLRTLSRTRLGRNLYIALCHYPVVNKFGEKVAVSVTNLDLHDMARVARSYGLGGFYATTPIEDQKGLAEKLLGHWREGAGAKANPDRAEAFSKVKVFDDIEGAVLDIEAQTGQCPRLAATSARLDRRKQAQPALTFGEVRSWLANTPVLLIFGTGHGLAEEVLSKTDGIVRPLRYLDDYNHLSVRSAVAIIVDRLIADEY